MATHSALYAAFEAWPGLKGAQTHIRHTLQALRRRQIGVTLVSLGKGTARHDPETGAWHEPIGIREPNFLRRSEQFGQAIQQLADRITTAPHLLQFRDIWSGWPLLQTGLAHAATVVYEVNGLPSLELVSHYPALAANAPLLARIRWMEQQCLERADRIVTVSRVNRACLIERGVAPDKIHVVTNPAAPLAESAHEPAWSAPLARTGATQLVYVGTLAPWQGIEILLEAFRLLEHRPDLHLQLLSPTDKWARQVAERCTQLAIDRNVTLLTGLAHHQVQTLLSRATLALAPLTRGARNELQGCSPFKIIEAMACGTAVVASNLPAVRELILHGRDGWLVTPGSARALAAGIETLLDNPALRREIAVTGQARANAEFSVSSYEERIMACYGNFLTRCGGEL